MVTFLNADSEAHEKCAYIMRGGRQQEELEKGLIATEIDIDHEPRDGGPGEVFR